MADEAQAAGVRPDTGAWRSRVGLLLLLAAFTYIWIVPLVVPRGVYLWGHYRIRDLYLGFPVAVATFSALLALSRPPEQRRRAALALTAAGIGLVLSVYAVDVLYVFGFLGLWRTDYWLDYINIPRTIGITDSELGYTLKPGVSFHGRKNEYAYDTLYRTDENGFRNPLGLRAAEIVCLGDSYTEGSEVPEERTYTRRFGDLAGMTAVNLGRGGYGPQQELIVLRRFGLKYDPKVVVWQVFEGNDLIDAGRFVSWKRGEKGQIPPLTKRFFDNSLFNKAAALTAPRGREPDKNALKVSMQYPGEAPKQTWVWGTYAPDEPERKAAELAELTRCIEEARQLCDEHGIRFVVVFVPIMLRVMDPYVLWSSPADRARFLPTGRVEDPQDMGSHLARFCVKSRCDYIDLFSRFRREAAKGRHIYLPTDQHLDLEGHQLVAEELLRWLRQENIEWGKRRMAEWESSDP
jgi:hypothetical protein